MSRRALKCAWTCAWACEARCRLSKDQREVAFSIYEAYERHLKSQGLWDDIDCVFDALKTLLHSAEWRAAADRPVSYQKVYVDEVQDYTGKSFVFVSFILESISDDAADLCGRTDETGRLGCMFV